ncbi:MAG: secretin N-terminal domain-containing protein [Candidatus Krumholzibacteriia bacterium]
MKHQRMTVHRRLLLVSALVLPGRLGWEGPARAQDAGDPASRPMQLNVNAMPIREVLKVIADEGKLDIAIGEAVQGNVTLFVHDMPVVELLRLVVEMVGGTWAEEDGVIRVMSQAAYEARYGRPYRRVQRPEWIELEHVPVGDIADVVGALKGKTGQAVLHGEGNGVLVVASPARLKEIEKLLKAVDTPRPTAAFPVRNLPATSMVDRLKAYLPSFTRLEADPAGQRVLVTAPAAVINQAGAMISLLDISDDVETRILPLRYADGDSVLFAVEELMSPVVGTAWTDERTNRLVVSDFVSRLDQVDELIERLDVPLRQVLIEARIIQVRMSKDIKTGINWAFLQDELNASASFPSLASGADGLRVMQGKLADLDYEVVLEALETFGQTDLLSSPRIMVADGEEASIHVGSQIPYVTIETRETPAGSIDRFEKVTIVDVGVKLNVRARIHSDDTVTLHVEPEVSSVTAFSDDNIPIVETATASSRLMIQDGNTVILGGLNQEQTIENRSGIPVLGRIPLLKYLFSSTRKEDVRSELAILITPHILTGDEDMSEWIEGTEAGGSEKPGKP